MSVSTLEKLVSQPLAVQGGPRAVPEPGAPDELFHWPIVTEEDELVALEVLRAGRMSAWDLSQQFEAEWAAYNGRRFALSYPNGTLALQVAMWAAGIRRGDEIICPSVTYWASAMPAFALGATVAFADVDPDSLCLSAESVRARIGPRTRALMVVHYCGHPADMDSLLAVAEEHNLLVIEDVSHAHGGLYHGRMTGTFGTVAAMSMMSGKSFPVGEGGVLVTDDEGLYQRAISYAHYARHSQLPPEAEWKRFAGVPLGGIKGRLNQIAAAMGRVQLRHYPERMAAIQAGMNRFWDLLEGTPGLRAHRPPAGSGSTMGGWYNPVGHYRPEELGGLPLDRFIEAVQAEGGIIGRSVNAPLHLHPAFTEADIYGEGQPTRIASAERDLREPPGSLPVAEAVGGRAFGVPWFKHDDEEWITRHAAAFRKVALQAEGLG